MRQRGRPRHPDLLTPREWEVLSLVREGLSNREIGDRLGVSRDGIKYHISQILPKLGVSTRGEAAAWRPETPVAAAQPAGLASRLSRVSRVGLIATAGALLAGVVALGGAVGYSELSGGSGSPSESADAFAGGPPTASPDPIPTPSPDQTPAPPIAPDGSLGSVAYVKDGNLWLVNLDTGEDRLLLQREIVETYGITADEITAYQPEWSADGSWISLNIIDSTDFDNFRSPILVRAGDGFYEFGGGNAGRDWSPNDLLIYGDGALERPVGSFPDDYYHGADSLFVTNVGYGEAKWSPDGTRVAVSEATITYPGNVRNVAPPYRVSIVDPTSAQPTIAPNDTPAGVTRIFEATVGAGQPVIHSWSPDGKYILFWVGPGEGEGLVGEMAIVSIDNPSEIQTIGMTRTFPSSAAWSPDGSLFALTNQSKAIQILAPDGVVQNTVGDEGSAAEEPAWSPDGERLAYSKLGGIWTANHDGSDVTPLTNDPAHSDRYPQWSNDGSRIVFLRLDGQSTYQPIVTPVELWMINADGSDAHKLADLPQIDFTQHSGGVDWTHYLSWYQPKGLGPFATAVPPSPGPTFAGPTPPLPGTTKPPIATQ